MPAGEDDSRREAWTNLARAVVKGTIEVVVARHGLMPALLRPVVVVDDQLADIVLVERRTTGDQAVFYAQIDFKETVGKFPSLEDVGRWLLAFYSEIEPLAGSRSTNATEATLILKNETGATIEVPLEDCGQGPGLGAVSVSVVDGHGTEIVPNHRYHFDVRTRSTLDLSRYVEEPGELPNLPAFLQVEPYQQPGNTLASARSHPSRRLADDHPRACPECGGSLHLRVIHSEDVFYPILPDGGI
ncbi:MAG: hypothetical protein NUW23_02500, partial [Firmicutes bacterium]|nr:hypothetical protein [Bacillota bacterium]